MGVKKLWFANVVDFYPTLLLTSFLIPGMGLPSDHCMTQMLSAISSLGNAAKVIFKHCDRIQCPNCYNWWITKRVFELAVLIECYALYTKERPATVVCSVHPDEVIKWTWKDYGAFIRKCYARMNKLGITGGVRVFHALRIKDECKDEFRALGAKDSGGFWKMIRANVLNYNSWYSYVYLGAHLHTVVFPNFFNGNDKKDITITRKATLDTTLDTVKHLRYLLSHCGILVDSETQPSHIFGFLQKWKPENYLTDAQILSVKMDVAAALGVDYNPLTDAVMPKDEEEEDGYVWIPIHEFADYSLEQIHCTNAFITSIQNAEHRQFVEGLIILYNERRGNTCLDKHKRHVFLDDLIYIPVGFEVVVKDERP